MSEQNTLQLHGGPAALLIPLGLFVAATIVLFGVLHAFDLNGLAAAGLLTLISGSLLARDPSAYWKAALRGAASPLTATVVLLLAAAGVFSAVVKAGHVADGLVFAGHALSLSGADFTLFALLASTLFGTATGSSIGTLLTALPLLLPAGAALGADPALVAGAVLSGAIFGDHLSPVSDVTLISALTQRGADGRAPEIGDVVRARLPYALGALAVAACGALLAGGSTEPAAFAAGDPRGLLMLAPVAILIVEAVRTRDVLRAATTGIVAGTAIGLASGLFTATDLVSVEAGAVTGVFVRGLTSMSGVILLCITLFSFTEVAAATGLGEGFARLLAPEKGASPRRAEILLALSTLVVTTLFGAVTSASTALVGSLANAGADRAGLSPNRRAQLLSGFANSLPVLAPNSAFVLITLGLCAAEPSAAGVTPAALAASAFYPAALFALLALSVLTGLGREARPLLSTSRLEAAR